MLRVVLSSLIGAVALAACGASAAGPVARAKATTTTTRAPAASSPTTYGGVVGAASTQACLEDARQVQQASDYYAGMHGSAAPSMDALVSAGILHEVPTASHGYVITYDPRTGKVTASGACTVQ